MFHCPRERRKWRGMKKRSGKRERRERRERRGRERKRERYDECLEEAGDLRR